MRKRYCRFPLMCPKGFPSFLFSAGFRSRIERRRGEVGGEAQSEAAATHAPRHSGNLFTTTPAPTSGGAVPSPAPGAPLPGGFLRFFGGFAPAVRKDGRAQRAAAAPHAPRHNRNLLTTTPAPTSGGAVPFPAPRAPLPGGFRRFFGEARRRGRRGGEGWAERRRAAFLTCVNPSCQLRVGKLRLLAGQGAGALILTGEVLQFPQFSGWQRQPLPYLHKERGQILLLPVSSECAPPCPHLQ